MAEGRILLTRAEYRTLRTAAEQLRRQGLSYREIRQQIPVAKATLSGWCQHIKLSLKQIQRLNGIRPGAFLGAKTNHEKSIKRKQEAHDTGLTEIGVPTQETLKVAGALLYWAEGAKTRGTMISNSDPVFIVFMVEWFERVLNIDRSHIKAHLHLHQHQNENEEKLFWSNLTRIPIKNFGKSFIKPVGTGHRKNILYHGTMRLSILGHNPELLRYRIMSWAQAVARCYVPQEVINFQYRHHKGR